MTTAIRPYQTTSTLDEFLDDPLVVAELVEVIRRLGEDMSALPETGAGTLKGFESVRIKAREWTGKRERMNDDDAARLIVAAWKALRP